MPIEPQVVPIDARTLARWLEALCRHDTTTGHEDAGLAELIGLLEQLGANVLLQEVGPGRTNVLARWGAPLVLLATHTDTVPPYLPPSVDAERVRGRGACDAKGQIVAQLGAIARLLDDGDRDVAWLGVVGEEIASDGAAAALDLSEALGGCDAVIVGEPTELRLAAGQRGIQHLRLATTGRAAHSGTPERGINALTSLIEWIQSLADLEPVVDPDLGPDSWCLTRTHGGEASNVVPSHATAEIMVRTVPGSRCRAEIENRAPAGGSVETLNESPPLVFPPVPGFESAPVPFGSDAPVLRALARDQRVVLAGPGSIEVAHSADESIRLDELEAGVQLNVRLVRALLDEAR